MFGRLLDWVRGVLAKMLNTSDVKRVMQVDTALSSAMQAALTLWTAIYENRAPWLSEDVKSLNLGATVAGEIARAVTIEMAVTVTGSARADYLAAQLARVVPKLREQVERGSAKGGIVFKPFVDGARIVVDTVPADMFLPVAFDADGDITAAIFADQRQRGQEWYTRLEYHELADTGYTIRNAAFKSAGSNTLGSAVPLTEVDEWADLAPEATILGVDRPLYGYFRFPLANTIDPSSPLGVSCYSRAVDLIKQADMQWSELLWEFQSGSRALYVDEQAFARGSDDKPILPDKRLYRTLAMAGQVGGEELFKDWTPTLREENILRGLNAILKRIEYACGLAYGTLSDPQFEAKTATEVRTSQQRSYVTITDTQKALRTALDALLYAMDVWATAYALAPRGPYKAEYAFGDSVVADRELMMAQDRQAVTMGVMPKYKFLMRNYGLNEAEARAWLKDAQAEQPEDPFGFEGAPA